MFIIKRKVIACFLSVLIIFNILNNFCTEARRVEAFAFAIPFGYTALEYLGSLLFGVGSAVGLESVADTIKDNFDSTSDNVDVWRKRLKAIGMLFLKWIDGSLAENNFLSQEEAENKAGEIINFNTKRKKDSDDNPEPDKFGTTALSLGFVKNIADFFSNLKDAGTTDVQPFLSRDDVNLYTASGITYFNYFSTAYAYYQNLCWDMQDFYKNFSGREVKNTINIDNRVHYNSLIGLTSMDIFDWQGRGLDSGAFEKIVGFSSNILNSPIAFIVGQTSDSESIRLSYYIYRSNNKIVLSPLSYADLRISVNSNAELYKGSYSSISFYTENLSTYMIPNKFKDVPVITYDAYQSLYENRSPAVITPVIPQVNYNPFPNLDLNNLSDDTKGYITLQPQTVNNIVENNYLGDDTGIKPEQITEYKIVTNIQYVPEKDIQDFPQPSQEPEENKDKYLMPDVRDLFPFCLPFDLIDILKAFSAEPETPNFKIPIKVDFYGIHLDYTINIDFSMLDPYMYYVRIVERVGFIIGLIFISRKMIGD